MPRVVVWGIVLYLTSIVSTVRAQVRIRLLVGDRRLTCRILPSRWWTESGGIVEGRMTRRAIDVRSIVLLIRQQITCERLALIIEIVVIEIAERHCGILRRRIGHVIGHFFRSRGTFGFLTGVDERVQ